MTTDASSRAHNASIKLKAGTSTWTFGLSRHRTNRQRSVCPLAGMIDPDYVAEDEAAEDEAAATQKGLGGLCLEVGGSSGGSSWSHEVL